MTDVLLEVVGLKALARAGWVRAGIAAPESVAAHSWGIAWLVLVLLPAELDLRRALAYAALHDLPEVRTGDLTPHDAVAAEKHEREGKVMRELCAPLGERGAKLLDLWQRYEEQADEEARFVRQLDRLDMAIQAVVYARATRTPLREFVDSAARDVTHPALLPILAELRRRL